MNIKQLRCICVVARSNLNVTRAAEALHTSQPGVSTQIQHLEQELGVQIFVREGNRLASITPQGEAIIERARRALLEIDELREIGASYLKEDSGSLTIAASHAQARFVLPAVVRKFTDSFPKVSITVRHGASHEITDLLRSRQADIGLLSGVGDLEGEIAPIPCTTYRRVLLVSADHALAKSPKPTLAQIAAHPLVQFESSRTGAKVMEVFASHGLVPRSTIQVTNADVVKAYVEHGLGIAILPELVYDKKRDPGLRCIDASHLFDSSTSYVLLHRSHFLRGYAFRFIEMLAPQLTRHVVQQALLSASQR